MTKNIITRFAPSPTGMLHIGGARTALFNYLFSKHNKGKFLLRIEDTDQERSSKAAVHEILASMKWLGLNYDDEIYYQSQHIKEHQKIAHHLLKTGKAYYCYATKEELAEKRAKAQKENKRYQYDRKWRDKDTKDAPQNIKPVIRIKAPISGKTEFIDQIQGKITIKNQEQEDFIILRSDGTPTYMLAVVVDDYNMNISHIIRGDDHLTNCTKQIILYDALGWDRPIFAHIPLIYGQDGKKLSKRHGATAVSEYQNLGYLTKAMNNYLLRLGFSHGDAEIISEEEAIAWFNLDNVGKSPARFDIKKLDNLNSYYLKNTNDQTLVKYIYNKLNSSSKIELVRLKKIIAELKIRAVTLNDLMTSAKFLQENFDIKNSLTEKALKQLNEHKNIAPQIIDFLQRQVEFDHHALYENSKIFAQENNLKLKNLAAFFRAALTGSHISPSIFEIMEIFTQEETIKRINLAIDIL